MSLMFVLQEKFASNAKSICTSKFGIIYGTFVLYMVSFTCSVCKVSQTHSSLVKSFPTLFLKDSSAVVNTVAIQTAENEQTSI